MAGVIVQRTKPVTKNTLPDTPETLKALAKDAKAKKSMGCCYTRIQKRI
ncbi:MAG: hypothetical protein R2794_13650 [Chitinophagales bacterium]